MNNLKSREIEMMRHAQGAATKNHQIVVQAFATAPGSEDDVLWRRLVGKGFATLVRKPTKLFPYMTYTATEEGKRRIGNGM